MGRVQLLVHLSLLRPQPLYPASVRRIHSIVELQRKSVQQKRLLTSRLSDTDQEH